ncbi:MAG TPA: hypothetical protein VKJ65_04515 [Phycisphaerae bacterium]|nr:hypothetical protein [Phycisphaerae bacterium]
MAEKTNKSPKSAAAKSAKDHVLAFKVDARLAELLGSVKNKSELIRDAVYAYLGHLCPLCEGKGTIPANRGHEIELLLQQLEFAACTGCHTALPVMPRLRKFVKNMPRQDRDRLAEYQKTGELLCSDCFEKADQCGTCGQHVPHGQLEQHQAKQHTGGRGAAAERA